MTIDTAAKSPSPTRGRRRMAFVSAMLASGLLLGGCASDATTTTSTSVSASDSSATSSSTADATTADTISTSAQAAEAFLATLSDEQREQVTYAFDDETKTTSWSNFPVTFVDRAGLNLSSLTDEQQAAAMKVLDAATQRRRLRHCHRHHGR